MPRFYFDLVNDGVTIEDQDGLFIGQVEDAEMQSAAMLGELLFASASIEMPKTLAVLIKDDQGALIARVTLALTSERQT